MHDARTAADHAAEEAAVLIELGEAPTPGWSTPLITDAVRAAHDRDTADGIARWEAARPARLADGARVREARLAARRAAIDFDAARTAARDLP